jgi:hypothetical protein
MQQLRHRWPALLSQALAAETERSASTTTSSGTASAAEVMAGMSAGDPAALAESATTLDPPPGKQVP